MASTARIDELKKKFDENPRRYFAPLANEFRKSGEIEQAIMICEEFLPQQPGHMSGHIVYGQALFEASRFEESRTVFETALTLDPENLIALRHLGDIARGQGDVDSARRWYDRVLEADPRNEEIQALIALIDPAGGGAAAAPGGTSAHASAGSATAPSSWEPPPSEPPPLPAAVDFEPTTEYAPRQSEFSPSMPPNVAESAASSRAEGLESVEFTPLDGPVDRAHDLGSSLEPGEFTRPSANIEPLAGLEETSVGAFERNTPDGGPDLIMLDTSEPMPSRDTAEERPSPHRAANEFERADDPDLAARGMISTPAERDWAAAPDLLPDLPLEMPPALPRESTAAQPREAPPHLPASADDAFRIPPELPPSVIAAEAELMDYGDPLPDAGAEPAVPSLSDAVADAPTSPAPTTTPAAAPFVTETMAELFVKQGLREQAIAVYRQLLSARPDDARLAARLAALEPTGVALPERSIREFLVRFATLRPGERASAAEPPSDDDFALTAPASAAEPERLVEPPPPPAPPQGRQTPTSVMSTGIERGAATQGGSGSIDALFGTRAAGTSEDSAASALAQAFGGGLESSPAITGRPARAAAGELSLDSVFRGGAPRPPRASQSFSFDEFFAPGSGAKDQSSVSASPPTTSDPSTPSEPAERNADDIEQFNSWLQGLKPK